MFAYQWNLQFPLIAARMSHYKNSAFATTYKHSELDKSELEKIFCQGCSSPSKVEGYKLLRGDSLVEGKII